MDHFGVELDAIILPRFVGDEGIRRAIAGRDDFKAGRKACDLVAMAHPHLMRLATFPKAVEQGAGFFHRNRCAAKFAAVACADTSAQLHHHRLLAITNAKNGQAAVEYALRCTRGIAVRGGGWAT